ncbi:MAG: chaperone NapD [Magnetococcales bacterium]|nr:chaperone NapD [Magnetococcales bacterium]
MSAALPDPEPAFALASAVLLVRPDFLSSVAAAVQALPGVELHATDPDGKMLITLEDHTTGPLVERFELIKYFDGVLSADLIYQHSEETPDLSIEETVP